MLGFWHNLDHIEKIYAIVAFLGYDPFAHAIVKQ